MIVSKLNEADSNGLILFNGCPNILSVYEDEYFPMQYAYYSIIVNSSNISAWYNSTSKDGQYYINIGGETISNVMDSKNVGNRAFKVYPNAQDTIMSIMMALRNCPVLSANYDIYQSNTSILAMAKEYGEMHNTVASTTNIPSTYITIIFVDGQDTYLTGAKVLVDIYDENNSYKTTLEKTANYSGTSFNLSPILTTIGDTNRPKPFYYTTSYITPDGQYVEVATKEKNYISIGSERTYLQGDVFYIAGNYDFTNGTIRTNNNTLYVYTPILPICWYWGGVATTSATVTIDYLDSAYNIIDSATFEVDRLPSTSIYYENYFDLLNYAPGAFKNAFYIDFSVENYKIRFNVIKPIKATEYCQRIYFRNSMGGVGFVDLTGKKTIDYNLSSNTYEKNIYDYWYTRYMESLEKPYEIRVNGSYSNKSHVFEESGKWVYLDLLKTTYAWIVDNGIEKQVIIDDIDVAELDNSNNLYEATVKWHLSMPETL